MAELVPGVGGAGFSFGHAEKEQLGATRKMLYHFIPPVHWFLWVCGPFGHHCFPSDLGLFWVDLLPSCSFAECLERRSFDTLQEPLP